MLGLFWEIAEEGAWPKMHSSLIFNVLILYFQCVNIYSYSTYDYLKKIKKF